MKALLISDIHGNLDALKRVIEDAKGYDEIWVLGDLVDYGPEPHLVIDLIKGLRPELVIRGNHDHAVAFGVDCRCGEKTHELSVYTRENISLKLIAESQRSWLGELPLVARRNIAGSEALIVHGSPRDPIYGYLYPQLGEAELLRMLAPASRYGLGSGKINYGIAVVGHTHIPMDIRAGPARALNPGSVGQPRDGDPRASYGILDLDTGDFAVYRVKYDVNIVIAKLRNLLIEERMLQQLSRILSLGIV